MASIGALNRFRARMIRPDVNAVQLIGSVALLGFAWLDIRPLALTGRGLAVALLLILNSVMLLARHTPDEIMPQRYRLPMFLVAAVMAAALLAIGQGGIRTMFGFFVAGQAGYRLERNRAVAVGVLCSVLCGGVLAVPIGWNADHVPWYVGAATGLAVPLGLVTRSRRQTVEALQAAAASAERASQAEARELISAERARIARDVHDLLAHSLAGINMQLEMADALLDQGQTERARQAARRAQSIARESLGEAQRTVRALREDALPVAETLAALAEADDRIAGLRVIGTVRELDTAVAQALIRAAQEALTNAHKHAPGAPVEMSLQYLAGAVRLEVQNAPSTAVERPLAGKGSGMGLLGMRERTALLGGQASAAPSPDGGWLVSVQIPTGDRP
ncbi:MAG TPA: histidine kinase [Jatrophihabitans sp.]|nr:histidine kinase [Jatrophihabitans sp.]